MGLKTQFGWKPDGAGGVIMPPDLEGERPEMKIVFVVPTAKPEDDEPERFGQQLIAAAVAAADRHRLSWLGLQNL